MSKQAPTRCNSELLVSLDSTLVRHRHSRRSDLYVAWQSVVKIRDEKVSDVRSTKDRHQQGHSETARIRSHHVGHVCIVSPKSQEIRKSGNLQDQRKTVEG